MRAPQGRIKSLRLEGRKMRLIEEKRGFTLVEALVYMAILGIFSLLLVQLITTYPKLNQKLGWKMDVIRLSRILDVKLSGLFDAINDGVNPPYRLVLNNNCTVTANPPVSRCVQVYTLPDAQFWSNPTNVSPGAYTYITFYFDNVNKRLVEDPDGTPNNGDETIILSGNASDNVLYVRGLRDITFTIEESGAPSQEGRYLNIYVSIDTPSQAVAGGTVTLRTVISASAPF